MRKAIVMAGGQGARLRPLTLTRPKPMVPVANRPVMAHILEWLRNHGFSEVLVTLYYRADDIRRAFGDGLDHGFHVEAGFLGEVEAFGQPFDQAIDIGGFFHVSAWQLLPPVGARHPYDWRSGEWRVASGE